MPTKINTITVVPNLEKADVPSITSDLIEWFSERDVKAVIPEGNAIELGRPDLAGDDLAIQGSGAAVCLGGDGTILRAVRMLKGAPVPIVGINLGRVGFLSEVEYADMYPAMERLINGGFSVDKRMMLKCTVRTGDIAQDYLALNEIVIERSCLQRMLVMDVYINDIPFSRYTADGLIFATPTGSTAYLFSAGGPVVSPANELILFAPINPHSLFDRTVVLGAQDRLKIELTKSLDATIGVDGFPVLETVVNSFVIEKADSKVLLIKLKEKSFYTRFKEKLRVWDTWLR